MLRIYLRAGSRSESASVRNGGQYSPFERRYLYEAARAGRQEHPSNLRRRGRSHSLFGQQQKSAALVRFWNGRKRRRAVDNEIGRDAGALRALKSRSAPYERTGG